ncbi:MAG: Gfo/Idh/MocA family oxidoreductase [Candidatus Hydrogenedentes bacterium]|nr:Gfo/Idh/MocA family oxidoreductase [Candidatus Hydrogenedentota bacterium]
MKHKVTPSRTFSRRDFMKSAAVLVAGAAVGPNIISSAYGAVTPSNRITLGMIGMGKMMGGHLSLMLNNTSCQVVALCDVESKRLERDKNRANEHYASLSEKGSYKGCDTYKDFRELVARGDIDAVMIATPEHWHAIPCIAAAKSGKDIYCEKPFTHTINEGKAVVDAVRRYGRVFQTGSQQRSEKGFRVACELVRNGRIGKVHTVHVNVGGPPVDCYLPPQPVPEGLDWDMWLGPAPWRPYNADIAPDMTFDGWPNWRAYRDYSGGMMCDWGAHHFDIAQWGLGMDNSGPVEIIPPNDKDVKFLTYKYANGVTMYHGGGAGGKAGVEFIGTEGRVMVNRSYLETDPPSILQEPIGPNDIHLYESPSHHTDWIDCIRTRKRPICDVEIGHHSITVCHLGNIAYWLKRSLNWNPEQQQFVNDSQATRLMDRAMRSPWTLETV